jgi:hypothetical protein
MPRRNRNAGTPRPDRDRLADEATQLARELSQAERINAVLAWVDSWQIEVTHVTGR